jgi:hypothetical protein
LLATLHEAINDVVLKSEPVLPERIGIISGRFRFTQLKDWYDQMKEPVLGTAGVVLTDIDDARNLLHVGVENLNTQLAVESELARLGIPREAVEIELTEPVSFQSTLRDRYRPLVGGLQTTFTPRNEESGFNTCTIGFMARASVKGSVFGGFVTNSHCSWIRSFNDGTYHYQPTYSTDNEIGLEILDPKFFSGGVCPSGRQCRRSDSAFVVTCDYHQCYDPKLGLIALPALGSIDWNGTTSTITSKASSPVVGHAINKVGRTTGRTSGTVTKTCVNINVNSTNITYLCQSQASYSAASGDSGSPVFRIPDPLKPSSVQLYGIHWGSNDNSGLFSPISFVQLSSELGPLTTCASGSC